MTPDLLAKADLRFALLGAGHHLCGFARMLVERGFPAPVVVTHPEPEHLRDRQLLTDPDVYADVFVVARELGLELIEAKSVNKAEVIDALTDAGCSAAFSLSCRSIIRTTFLDAFGRRVFNIHPTWLPEERGGGTFSWRILNRRHQVSATVHMIDEGIDSGGILLQHKEHLDDPRPTPHTFLAETNRVYALLLGRFLDAVEAGETLEASVQDESRATYLPRLHTETNGAIDWSWPAADVERFVRAFAAPYPGAFTYVGEQRLGVLEAVDEDADGPYHPFCAGRPISRDAEGRVRVIAGDGRLVRIDAVTIDGEAVTPAEAVPLTAVLDTPPDILRRGRTSVVKVKDMRPRQESRE